MHLHIAIVDDQQLDRDLLKNGIESHYRECGKCDAEIICFSSAEAFLEAFVPGTFNLIFFDICMGGMSGTEAAAKLRHIDKQVLIVFVTSTMEYVFDTFSSHPFEYLQKPFKTEKLNAVLHEACLTLFRDEAKITVSIPHGSCEIAPGDIISVTANGHMLEIHLMNGDTLESNMKFAELENLLAEHEEFLTVNRGILINMNYTASIADGMAHLADGSFYPVRIREKSKIASIFSQFMLNQMQNGGKHK